MEWFRSWMTGKMDSREREEKRKHEEQRMKRKKKRNEKERTVVGEEFLEIVHS